MKTVCDCCGDTTRNIKSVDIPAGKNLCDECYRTNTWACDLCGTIHLGPEEPGECWWVGKMGFECVCLECQTVISGSESSLMSEVDSEIESLKERKEELWCSIKDIESQMPVDIGPLNAELILAQVRDDSECVAQIQSQLQQLLSSADGKRILELHDELAKVSRELAKREDTYQDVREDAYAKCRAALIDTYGPTGRGS